MGRARNNGKSREASEDEPVAVAPVELAIGIGKTEVGEAAQQRGKGELSLHTGEHGAEAVMDAVPEGKVTGFGPVDVELLGVFIVGGVSVGGRQTDDHLGADRDRHVADLHGLDRVAKCRVGNGGVEAEALLHGRGELARVASKFGELVGVA